MGLFDFLFGKKNNSEEEWWVFSQGLIKKVDKKCEGQYIFLDLTHRRFNETEVSSNNFFEYVKSEVVKPYRKLDDQYEKFILLNNVVKKEVRLWEKNNSFNKEVKKYEIFSTRILEIIKELMDQPSEKLGGLVGNLTVDDVINYHEGNHENLSSDTIKTIQDVEKSEKDKKDGQHQYKTRDGRTVVENYKGGKLHGKTLSYKNKRLIHHEEYIDGVQVFSQEFNDDGKLICESKSTKDGELFYLVEWYEDGEKKNCEFYQYEDKSSVDKSYFVDGSLFYENYIDEKGNTFKKEWNEQGVLIKNTKEVNGKSVDLNSNSTSKVDLFDFDTLPLNNYVKFSRNEESWRDNIGRCFKSITYKMGVIEKQNDNESIESIGLYKDDWVFDDCQSIVSWFYDEDSLTVFEPKTDIVVYKEDEIFYEIKDLYPLLRKDLQVFGPDLNSKLDITKSLSELKGRFIKP